MSQVLLLANSSEGLGVGKTFTRARIVSKPWPSLNFSMAHSMACSFSTLNNLTVSRDQKASKYVNFKGLKDINPHRKWFYFYFQIPLHTSKGSKAINLVSITDKDQAGNDFSCDIIEGLCQSGDGRGMSFVPYRSFPAFSEWKNGTGRSKFNTVTSTWTVWPWCRH